MADKPIEIAPVSVHLHTSVGFSILAGLLGLAYVLGSVGENAVLVLCVNGGHSLSECDTIIDHDADE